MNTTENADARSQPAWKIPKRFAPIVFAFYMAGIMAFLMCAVIVATGTGLKGAYLLRVLEAYALAMPVAFVCVICVRPIVMRLTAATVRA
ncbi:hypothetical protein RD110_13540 [Rhodoferax koreense]|uniref:DUF2798 domain-containing protein n=1 Tax=Rhodoferax koreensis TaxID=1842727 RepID=A0A1P8JWG1_9BURK|nr:DUF2798 domain-containing protein [Rhodoferax koreense]APW38092.1 hypothetical protein RD110_13540 [Rhodoferax koreense]